MSHPPRTAAERQRIRRRRRADGRVIVPVEIDLGEVADALVQARLLSEWDTEDRGKVAGALSKIITTWLRHA